MKKKMISLAAGMCMAALLLTGCSGEISNEYVTISQYKGIEVEKPEAQKVTDEMVDARIQEILESKAGTTKMVDRAAKNGDVVIIDYVGKMDGKAFEGGTADAQSLKLGSGSYIDGFEAGVVGHEIGETFDLKLKFPKNYPSSPDKAGKEAVFTVTLKGIVPEVSDEVIAKISETAKTVDEYKKELKKELEKDSKASTENALKENVMAALMENTEVTKYPKEDLKEMQKIIRTQYENMASYYGLDFTEFLSTFMKLDEDTFNTQLVKAAKTQVKQQLAIDLIAEKAKIDVSEKALEKRYEIYAKEYKFESVEQMKKEMKDNGGEDQLKQMAKIEIVQDWLVENCKQVEKKADDSSSNK